MFLLKCFSSFSDWTVSSLQPHQSLFSGHSQCPNQQGAVLCSPAWPKESRSRIWSGWRTVKSWCLDTTSDWPTTTGTRCYKRIGSQIQTQHNLPPPVFLCSTLVLTRISSEDEAIYQCIAENSAGTNQASARLAVAMVKDLPAAPEGLTATPLSTNALHISWREPPPNVTDSIIGYVLHLRKIGGWCHCTHTAHTSTHTHTYAETFSQMH